MMHITQLHGSSSAALYTGGLNLMRHAKKSTNRDFRITIQEVPEAEEEAQDEEAEQGSQPENQVCECMPWSCVCICHSWCPAAAAYSSEPSLCSKSVCAGAASASCGAMTACLSLVVFGRKQKMETNQSIAVIKVSEEKKQKCHRRADACDCLFQWCAHIVICTIQL